MRRKMLTIPIVLTILLGILSAGMIGNPVAGLEYPGIYVEPAIIMDETMTPGQNFTVAVKTDYTGSDITGWWLDISFNASVLNGVVVDNGDLITTDVDPWAVFLPGLFDNVGGGMADPASAFFFTMFPPPAITSGPGTLAYITFQVVGSGESAITIELGSYLVGWDTANGKEYRIVDASSMPQHLRHGLFSNLETVQFPPVTSFTWEPVVPQPNETVTFDASASYDPDGTLVSYEWDFGDGDNGTGLTATHVYSTEGYFTATLTVTDNDDITGMASATFEALLPPPPGEVDLAKWKLKVEHQHFSISREDGLGEDAFCDIIALVKNTLDVAKEVTVEFEIMNKETMETVTLSVTDTVADGTQKLLTCTEWAPGVGAYTIIATGYYDEDTTSTKIKSVRVVP